jgi:hypothetical protein
MCLVVAGCGPSSSPTPLAPFTLSPTPTVYTGTVVDSHSGNGTLTVSLVTVAGLTSGTWDALFGGKDAKNYISGTVSGNAYKATFSPCPETDSSACSPDCGFSFSGTFTSAGLSGTYTASSSNQQCPAETGSISLIKQ